MGNYVLNNVQDFDISQTLECGQCFHFVKIDQEEYVISAKNRLLHIKQVENDVIFYNTSKQEYEEIWKDYFDLDRDYASIKKILLEKDDKLKTAIESMWGVRILNQDFFETLISFIISQNKQIPHIKKIVSDISVKYGSYLGDVKGVKMFSFPTIEQLSEATVEDLKELKTGFRAPYIKDAIEKVRDAFIDEAVVRMLTYDEAIKYLCQIKGVGEKVANCVSLFSLGKREAFPIDVWIKRIMEAMYFEGKDTSKEIIAEYAKNAYGELGGYAQQYLFYYGKSIKMGKNY